MARIYWYAPFDNAGELSVATALADQTDHHLTVESCRDRFGQPLDPQAPGNFQLVRDLPAPAGEDGQGRSAVSRAKVAFTRASTRNRLVRGGAFDLLHLHTFNPVTDWYSIRQLRRHAPHIIQSVHNVRPHDSVFPRPVETRLLGAGYRACGTLVVAHQSLARQLVDDFGLPEAKVRVIPLPVLSDAFASPRTPAATSDGATTRFLFFGTLRNNKGISVLLDAIASLNNENDLRFVFAGRGEPALEDLVLAASTADRRIETELGYVENERRRQLYASSDVVVLPYTAFDAQSGVLQDAYAASRPVIVSRVGALGEAVDEDGTGWLVRAGDSGDLARAIREAARSADERRRFGSAAGALAAARRPGSIADCLADLYAEVLTSSP
jgi:glycosyltransferase involved in cell wall biosynthesis